jgi:hypothetical protein
MSDPVSANHENGLAYTSADLLVAVTLFGLVLGGYTAFGPWGAAPIAFVSAVLLNCLGHHYQRRLARVLGRLLILPAFLATVGALYFGILFGILPERFTGNWPDQVEETARVADASLDDVRVAKLPGFLDTEYVWRQSVPADGLESVVQHLGAKPHSSGTAPPEFFAAFPFLWRPSQTGHHRFFVTPDFVPDARGEDGQHYCLMYDLDNQRL